MPGDAFWDRDLTPPMALLRAKRGFFSGGGGFGGPVAEYLLLVAAWERALQVPILPVAPGCPILHPRDTLPTTAEDGDTAVQSWG